MAPVVEKNTFRSEVLSGNSSGDFGEIRVLHSISGWAITVASMGMALTLLLIITYGTVAKNVSAAGVTETLASGPTNTVVVATVFVPVINAAALTPGQRIKLHYDAYPYQKYGLQIGIVHTVDTGFLYANGLPEGVQAKLRRTANGGNIDTITYRRMTLSLLTPEIRDNGQTQKVPAGLLLEVNLPQAPTPLSRWLLGNRT
ncbi:hypothetical protein [Janthinobacterium sp. UMAB-60]|uniref:hypothetical protein n=1 Tax=Janthinobacterium sp. UMAB-60 TaxID=1365365 RepID=UPI001C5746B8|nr:hypothetical protein [Janthinobacterium sp. UMAB-60]